MSTKATVTRSELIDMLVDKQPHLAHRDVEFAVKAMLEKMGQSFVDGDRIEIRGFGSFSLHYRPARIGRNPKTGESVTVEDRFSPHFKPGKELKLRVDAINN
jgi:integration host factor subunit beta